MTSTTQRTRFADSACLYAATDPEHVCKRRDGRILTGPDQGDCHLGAVLHEQVNALLWRKLDAHTDVAADLVFGRLAAVFADVRIEADRANAELRNLVARAIPKIGAYLPDLAGALRQRLNEAEQAATATTWPVNHPGKVA